VLQLRGLLGGCTPDLVLLVLLAGVRLRLRLRRKLLLLILDTLLRKILGRDTLRLRTLLLLLLVVDLLLLWCCVGSLAMHLRVYEEWAWRVLGVERLIFVGGLRSLYARLVALVLLLLARLLLRL
jgi:hypothetical protein